VIGELDEPGRSTKTQRSECIAWCGALSKNLVCSLLEGQETAFASGADATKHCISEDRLVYLIGAIRIRSLKRATIAFSASPPSQNLGKRRKAA
jgi:hypothetical protein